MESWLVRVGGSCPGRHLESELQPGSRHGLWPRQRWYKLAHQSLRSGARRSVEGQRVAWHDLPRLPEGSRRRVGTGRRGGGGPVSRTLLPPAVSDTFCDFSPDSAGLRQAHTLGEGGPQELGGACLSEQSTGAPRFQHCRPQEVDGPTPPSSGSSQALCVGLRRWMSFLQ